MWNLEKVNNNINLALYLCSFIILTNCFVLSVSRNIEMVLFTIIVLFCLDIGTRLWDVSFYLKVYTLILVAIPLSIGLTILNIRGSKN